MRGQTFSDSDRESESSQHSLRPAARLLCRSFLPMPGSFLLLRKKFAVIFRRSIERIERARKNKLVLSRFLRGNIGRVLQGAQLRLELGVGVDDQLQRLANVVFAIDVGIDVIVQLVVNQQEV